MLPAVRILGRRDVFIEDLIVSLSMSLESAGHILGVREDEEKSYRGKKPTTATFVYRCRHTLELDWGDRVESLVGLARATANSYNATKHFNGGELPGNYETFLISQVLRKVVRLMTLHIFDPSGELLKSSGETGNLWRIHDMFLQNELRMTHAGKWGHEPKPKKEELPDGLSF